jgi:hypothetical protein
MDTEKLKQIKIGHPFRYGPYMIDRYMAGNGLGWIVQAPGIMSFLLRRTVICFPVAFNLESISGKVDPVVPHGCYVMAR